MHQVLSFLDMEPENVDMFLNRKSLETVSEGQNARPKRKNAFATKRPNASCEQEEPAGPNQILSKCVCRQVFHYCLPLKLEIIGFIRGSSRWPPGSFVLSCYWPWYVGASRGDGVAPARGLDCLVQVFIKVYRGSLIYFPNSFVV